MAQHAWLLAGILCSAWFAYETLRILQGARRDGPLTAHDLRSGRRLRLRRDRRRRGRRASDRRR